MKSLNKESGQSQLLGVVFFAGRRQFLLRWLIILVKQGAPWFRRAGNFGTPNWCHWSRNGCMFPETTKWKGYRKKSKLMRGQSSSRGDVFSGWAQHGGYFSGVVPPDWQWSSTIRKNTRVFVLRASRDTLSGFLKKVKHMNIDNVYHACFCDRTAEFS